MISAWMSNKYVLICFCFSDNPESDILGANLFHQVVRQRALQAQIQSESAASLPKLQNRLGPVQQQQMYTGGMTTVSTPALSNDNSSNNDQMVDINPPIWTGAQHPYEQCVQHCYSVLVETGVYSKCHGKMNGSVGLTAVHPVQSEILKIPSFNEADLFSAVEMIFKRENFTWRILRRTSIEKNFDFLSINLLLRVRLLHVRQVQLSHDESVWNCIFSYLWEISVANDVRVKPYWWNELLEFWKF